MLSSSKNCVNIHVLLLLLRRLICGMCLAVTCLRRGRDNRALLEKVFRRRLCFPWTAQEVRADRKVTGPGRKCRGRKEGNDVLWNGFSYCKGHANCGKRSVWCENLETQKSHLVCNWPEHLQILFGYRYLFLCLSSWWRGYMCVKARCWYWVSSSISLLLLIYWDMVSQLKPQLTGSVLISCSEHPTLHLKSPVIICKLPHLPSIYIGDGDPNSDFQICMARALLTEPSPRNKYVSPSTHFDVPVLIKCFWE